SAYQSHASNYAPARRWPPHTDESVARHPEPRPLGPRDPPCERRALLVLRPRRPELPPKVLQPPPQIVALDPLLRDSGCVEPKRLGGLQERPLVEPPLGRMRKRVRAENRLQRRFAGSSDNDRA